MIDVDKNVSVVYAAEIKPGDYRRFARGIEGLMDSDHFYITPIGRGAKEEFANLKRYFKSNIFPICLVQDYNEGDEYRKILGIQSAYFNGISDEYVKEALEVIKSRNKNHKSLFALESSIKKTGRGGIGGFVWALENAENLDLEEKSVYLGSFLDTLGVAQIRLFGEPEKHIGPVEFMNKNMPRTYDELGKKDLLKYAAEVPESDVISIGSTETRGPKTETRGEFIVEMGKVAALASFIGLLLGGKRR